MNDVAAAGTGVSEEAAPAFSDLLEAAAGLEGHGVETPLLESERLNRKLGGRLLIKAEVLQRAGSFKFRGAYNSIRQLDAEQRKRGVVAYSSGNHAQGVACAAALVGAPATIVMPKDAPRSKIANTRAYGAEIEVYDRLTQGREDIAVAMAARTGAILVKPYDAFATIAGQGTVGLEIAAQARDMGATPDAILVPCSGGGLTAGITLAARRLMPEATVHPVEPAGFEDWARSLIAGRRLRTEISAVSICDALQAPEPGEMTFAIAAPHLGKGYVVSDREVLSAMAAAFDYFKLVVEPGGAAALAAVLAGHAEIEGRPLVVVASGGNLDADLYARALQAYRMAS